MTPISIKVIPDGMSGSMLTSVRVIKNDNELDSEIIEIKPTGYLNLPNVAATICSYYQLKVEYDEIISRLHEIEPKYEGIRVKYTELLPQGTHLNNRIVPALERSLKDEFKYTPEPAQELVEPRHDVALKAMIEKFGTPEPVQEPTPEPKPQEGLKGRTIISKGLPPPLDYFKPAPTPTPEEAAMPVIDEPGTGEILPKTETIRVAAEKAPLHLMAYKQQAESIWEDVYSALKKADKTQFEETDLMAEAARCGVREENIDGVVQELIKVFQEKNATVGEQKQESTISKLLGGGKKKDGKKKSTK